MSTAKPTSAEVNEIQRRMAQVRHELHEDVREAVKGAQSLTDWRSQVRNHPWLALGAAAALGYLLVPKRRHEPAPTIVAVGPHPAALATAANAKEEPKKKKRWGLIGSAVGMLAPVAVRAAQNYAIQYLEQWLASQQAAGGGPLLGAGLMPGAPTSPHGPGRAGGPGSRPGAAPGAGPNPNPNPYPNPNPNRPREIR